MITECVKCGDNQRALRRMAQVNERRAYAGKPPRLEQINRLRAFIAACAASGHHDPQAGTDARWHSTA